MKRTFGIVIGLGAVVGIGCALGSAAKPKRLTVTEFNVTDGAAKTGYDVLADKPTEPNHEVMGMFRYSSATGYNTRDAIIRIHEPNTDDTSYVLEWNGNRARQIASQLQKGGNRVLRSEFPIRSSTKSVRCRLLASDEPWKVVWFGEFGKDSKDGSWMKVGTSYQLTLLREGRSKTVAEFRLEIDGRESGHIWADGPDGKPTVWIHPDSRSYKSVRVLRRDLRVIFDKPVAFGKPGSLKECDPPLTKPEFVAIRETTPKNAQMETDGWDLNGKPARWANYGSMPSGPVAFPPSEDMRILALRMHVPNNTYPNTNPVFSLTLDNGKLAEVPSATGIPMLSRNGRRFELSFNATTKAKAATLNLYLPTGLPKLERTILPRDFDPEHGVTISPKNPYAVVSVDLKSPKLSMVRVISKNRELWDNRIVLAKPMESPRCFLGPNADVSTPDIDRIEIYTFPTKTYTYQLPLNPK